MAAALSEELYLSTSSVAIKRSAAQRTMQREFDFVVYGATGYTGQYVVEELYRVIGRSKQAHRFAIAGRNQTKLNAVLSQASNNTGNDFSGVDTIVADSNNDSSLVEMAKRTHVVLNCVGPYRLYGEAVVKACVENGTGHVDISGETAYLVEMAERYHSIAEKNSCYVVGACGFDSIPCDLGVEFTRRQFDDGALSQIESVGQFHTGPEGYVLNSGTYQTVMLGIMSRDALRDMDRGDPADLPKPVHKLRASYHDGARAWLVPFLGGDRPIVNRSNSFFWKQRAQRPVQLQTYFRFTSLFWTLMVMLWSGTLFLLAQLPCLRPLIRKHVRFFSVGLFSNEGPTRAQVKQTTFSYWFYAKGWRTKADVDQSPPDRQVVVKCSGPDPAYTMTAAGIVNAAVLIREEHEKMPSTGGVYTTAAAFSETDVFERLAASGISFQVVA